jgi:hypothetical protein
MSPVSRVGLIDQNVNFGVCNLWLKEARYFSAILAGEERNFLFN